jgi:hypothetical protein
MEKNDNYDDIMYQLQRRAVIIDVKNLLLIKDPSDELIHLAFSCDAMKFVGGVPQENLTGNMLILKIKYESNLLKQRMMSKKRKYYDFT